MEAPVLVVVDGTSFGTGPGPGRHPAHVIDRLSHLASCHRLVVEQRPDATFLVFLDESSHKRLCSELQQHPRSALASACLHCVPFGCLPKVFVMEFARRKAHHSEVFVVSNDPDVVTESNLGVSWRRLGFMFIQEDLLLPGLSPTAIAPQSSRSMLKKPRGSWDLGDGTGEDSETLRDSDLDGVALDDETARAVDGLTDLDVEVADAETVLDAPLLGSRFHRESHLREACSDTLIDALDHEHGGERTDTVQAVGDVQTCRNDDPFSDQCNLDPDEPFTETLTVSGVTGVVESCPTVPGAGREDSDQAALPTLVLTDPCLDQPCQVPCSRIGSLADALAGGSSACDLPGVPTPVSLDEDTEDVIVVSSRRSVKREYSETSEAAIKRRCSRVDVSQRFRGEPSDSEPYKPTQPSSDWRLSSEGFRLNRGLTVPDVTQPAIMAGDGVASQTALFGDTHPS